MSSTVWLCGFLKSTQAATTRIRNSVESGDELGGNDLRGAIMTSFFSRIGHERSRDVEDLLYCVESNLQFSSRS